MGLSPDQVLAMPVHDYQAALHHFAKAQGGDEEDDGLSGDEFDEMLVGLVSHESRATH